MADSVLIDADAPIGVFDSGVGGLSVLRHIQAQLPGEHLLYFSDAKFAPYGPRPDHEIEQRALAIGAYLLSQHVKAIVVACNTATAVAIAALRQAHPTLIVIGVEPGLKPAAALSVTKTIGVLATEATLASKKFAQLRTEIEHASQVTFLMQPCRGLAAAIETGDLHSHAMHAMLHGFVTPLIDRGADTLVLGCTHYPFVAPQIAEIANERRAGTVELIDTGAAVARHLARVLTERHALRDAVTGSTTGATSGAPSELIDAFWHLLHWRVAVTHQAGA